MGNHDGLAISIAMIIAMLYVGTALFITAGKSCDVNIDYDVKVDPILSNITNPDQDQVGYACLKLCVDQLRTQQSKFTQCLEACDKLGCKLNE